MKSVYIAWAGDGTSTLAFAQRFWGILQNTNLEPINPGKSNTHFITCDELVTIDDDSGSLSGLIGTDKEDSLFILFISTSSCGSPPKGAQIFYKQLEILAENTHKTENLLKEVSYLIVGIGDSQFGDEYFCLSSLKINNFLQKLGATQMSKQITIDRRFHELYAIENDVFDKILNAITNHGSGESVWHSNDIIDSVDDIEDFGTKTAEMLSALQKRNLIKEGYRIIGSHSAVKLCRWTKSHMRGRGGCYKHTFYGIISSRCMEMTPSLACANKCVFCWRHHTNPVGTRWKWNTDDPQFIAKQAEEQHVKMVKELKGVLDIKSDRFEEAQHIKHCALSLVGEPIMYPHINQLIDILHTRQISTFLVTNAQFPDLLNTLKKVTQLYLSIDAFDKESLKKIDRPLFSDFWQRFQQSISILATRGERTVFRLTLVKQFNMTEHANELQDLAMLVSLGKPCFIEIKGVTYCGVNSDITMANVPWHDQVVLYAHALISASEWVGTNYTVICQHRHSCSVLIASNKFFFDGKWHTWIHYDKFHQLVNSGKDFGPLDYAAETPEWALLDSKHQGFDPEDTRWYRNGSKASNGVNRRKNDCGNCNCNNS
ncbi:S-adenosyl-L-methionine-dependent tRNA 4-demethylwyosine synthase [Babesia microti strain RI]|uniref:tRNA 4-demethylwyosine synthase (AdoMet-dependent) n=1 Tax=Babesia microti (strain RI) TaxID=1133968 RepID=A0A1R4A9V7_BABMR|nr:S-adenosyl-L-methionine-dependent tRNA 4-demethylwyosine synthase [Babesia microti strain RI]SJK85769.1 S-adenosyl-L-methionine-dependent tRNA 4-demethylwyosine synthase [Babesia microti strain RI]|eukprot:XP_021337992.1 S-adenosyl-L-methionine-dependent tRNA 4-demethylwyosine synthase [Babesia microti strain RI]